mgnify:FL=1
MQGARQKNSDLCLVGEKVVLVPYTKEHVPIYNAWMKSEYIRGLFGIA